ncbi:hypothetical protein GCM10010185_26260 [Saccharothrix coeruleofusca]|uniref:Uncharacterized protein n=1 Tax=Saccharothrix coeruleofusca TaxID=33919 RepID=A0A918AL25_9PSEU|nr:hypothetical protein GCM10010185_26260 [Saccharothrix coeruleofusca]
MAVWNWSSTELRSGPKLRAAPRARLVVGDDPTTTSSVNGIPPAAMLTLDHQQTPVVASGTTARITIAPCGSVVAHTDAGVSHHRPVRSYAGRIAFNHNHTLDLSQPEDHQLDSR